MASRDSMRAVRALSALRDEASCSVCLEFFADPVSTECGHNFCRPCLTRSWGPGATRGPCPQCRQLCEQGALRSNRQLLNMVELVRALPEGPPERAPEGSLCEEHREELKLFCEECQTPLCLVCSTSAQHRPHSGALGPLKEAALEYKETLQAELKQLDEQLEEVQGWSNVERIIASELEGKFKIEEANIIDVFENLKQFLEEMKHKTLDILKFEKELNLGKAQEKISELEVQESSLKTLIAEIEEKCKQQDLEALKDVKSLLSRCKVKVLKPKADLVEQQWLMLRYKSHDVILQEKINTFKDSVSVEIDKLGWSFLKSFKVPVTLDPDSAHQILSLYKNGSLLSCNVVERHWTDNPRRFTASVCVLGKEGFTSGRHYWEVQLHQIKECALGVALEAIDRKEPVKETPEGGIWALQQVSNQFTALTSTPSALSPCEHPRKLGLFLDYERGRLSLYNANTGEHLYTFSDTGFVGRVYPYFRSCEYGRVPAITMLVAPALYFGIPVLQLF